MTRKNYIIFTLLAILVLSLMAVTQANGQRYSGRATAIRATVGVPLVNPVTTSVNDTGDLPAGGGSITLASGRAEIAGASLMAGASSSATRGGTPAGTSHSETSVSDLSFTVLGNTITATTASTSTDCSCPAQTCTGGTVITGLTLNGAAVTVNGTVNQTINLTGPLGTVVGTLVINEHINGIGRKTVNAIHVNVTDSSTGRNTDIVIASSHSDVLCVVLGSYNFFSGRAYGIGNTVTTETVLVGSSNVAILIADTGPLPYEGGVIGPVVVAGSDIPGVATSGPLTTLTSGGSSVGSRTSQSSANVQNLSATVEGFGITATVLTSQTSCQCSTIVNTDSTCTGGSMITNLLITTPVGGTVTGTVTGAPNETVTLSVFGTVVATLIFNEQIPLSPTASGSITVNALHVITSSRITGRVTQQTDTIIASSHSDIECSTLQPTAAPVSVSGRVMNSGNRAVPRALVTLTSSFGETYSAMTNGLGYFTISQVPVGTTYLVDISARGYTFETRTLLVNDDLSGLIFVLE